MNGAEHQSVPDRMNEIREPVSPLESDRLDPRRGFYAKVPSRFVSSSRRSFQDDAKPRNPIVAEWLPYTLRRSVVWIPPAASLILGLAVGLLYWRSYNNNGLSSTSSAVFGWRFAPTLVAVVWAQFITMLYHDIQRTEPFARLARPAGHVPPASRTILEGPRQIWTTFAHAFNKKHNGGKRSWIVIWISISSVFSSIVISLSSVLLTSEPTNIWQPYDMTRLTTKKDSLLKPVVERDTYFRSTGAILQNATTSPWISDEYAILPFWPTSSPGSPWDTKFPASPQTWEAETTVFRNELQCSPLELTSTNAYHYNYIQNGIPNQNDLLSIRLENPSGCKYNLTFNSSDYSVFNRGEIGSWSVPETLDFGRLHYNHRGIPDWKPHYNDKCVGDQIIIMSSRWIPYDYTGLRNETARFLSNLTVSSYLCESKQTMAELPVRVLASERDFKVDFDIELFKSTQHEVPASLLNRSEIVEALIDPLWVDFIYRPQPALGALALVATQFQMDFPRMMKDPRLIVEARRIQGRHFGEMMRSSLEVADVAQIDAVPGRKMVNERRVVVRMEAAGALIALLTSCSLLLLGIGWLSGVRQRPLHLSHEPATVLGTVSLVSSSTAVLTPLRGLDQASSSELRGSLKDRYFSTSQGHLTEVLKHGLVKAEEPAARVPILAKKEAPVLVKVRFLVGLVFYIALLVMAVSVVHRFANDSDLKKGFFTYRVNFTAFGHLGSFTPFSIVPTTLAVILGIWWSALDYTFRCLQPYVSMSSAPRDMRRGAFVSYMSSYWLWATGKAAKNRHWLLSLVTFGTFVAQAFTIATSALFEQNSGVILEPLQLNRSLELRKLPHLRQRKTSYPPAFTGFDGVYGYEYVGETLTELFEDATNNWLYSGVAQVTLNASEPAFSKDGWSFVPFNLSRINANQQSSEPTNTDTMSDFESLVNITITTPAIRGRVECSQPDIANTSLWLQNETYTNYKTNKTFNAWIPNYRMFGGPLAPDAQQLTCCFNSSNNDRSYLQANPLSIGFWTQDLAESANISTISSTLNNFTVKWIHGDGAPTSQWSGTGTRPPLYFPEQPKIQALKCMPIFETSNAEIVVDQAGRVQQYRILDDPVPDHSAWTDAFIWHEVTDPDDPAFQKTITSTNSSGDIRHYAQQNITTSYGELFMDSLLRASRLNAISSSGINHGPKNFEDLGSGTFNIRNNITGLTLDFMSYAAYLQEHRDSRALLNEDTLLKNTQEIFSVFFQHYVSSNTSLMQGGWVYQPIGANLKGLGKPVNGTFKQYNPDGTEASKYNDLPAQNTQRVADATLSIRVEVLHMNQNAFWLCLALLIWLAITASIVTALQRWFFGDLRRGVDSIADVLVLVAGSERLLAAVEKYGVEGMIDSNFKTRLGWFRNNDGIIRWGIEIVEEGEILMS